MSQSLQFPLKPVIMARLLAGVAAMTAGAGARAGPYAGGTSVRVAICAPGAARFVKIDFGEQKPPAKDKDGAACHGPCVLARKKPRAEAGAGSKAA